ncbi:hypothetical protein FB565_008762 [Actinoplanes lutulentus]|uniref:hypothetical protein n=1 Tax=Actinoplanes lutulentus TaxID=1287878 RepID=UPI000DB9FFE6|nr:hypothetical protein [Actinoplanes lutulentus]MBB2948976.1 hypothetical protein [Actinoplanes lutulentus]
MDDALTVLRQEFDATEGSFLLRVRCDLVWDRAAFSRLERAMRVSCEQYESRDDLPRWLVEGFWDVSQSVADWTAHPNFPRPHPAQYYEDCLARLQDLADWFFRGWHPYQQPHVWRDL